ncbi:RES family NAD+ phosphorylase [Pseudomonas ogarae]|uniref:RES family NAD+ phosphorylase n=1 Tax=Pseudomonas ogarae (strain DSM 112162 / CECT 30235 / F113) TaxID=1114970 RepID=UPI001950466C|nr:RES family NAD+ phosphorylase [Pseudomonas ogarae]
MREGVDVVCDECVGDVFVQQRIRNECDMGRCSCCEQLRHCMPIEALADQVADILDRYYGTGPVIRTVDARDLGRYVYAGSPLAVTVAEMLGIDSESAVTAAIVGLLTVCTDYDLKRGGEARFDADLLYMRRNLRPTEIEEKWQEFKSGVMHRSRFFNDHGKAFLDWLFEGIHHLKDEHGREVVQLFEIEDGLELYRGRYCPPSSDPKKILLSPETELGAPPKEIARAGRMSPVGVPAFYGAFDRETCIAELRPSVGGMVLTGEFQLLRDARLLDFGVLENVFDAQPMSCFDPDYQKKMERRQFLRTLHSKISSPVTPDQEQEYLYTQVIAEYLATQVEPTVDGVMFASVQRQDGINIALFSRLVDSIPYQERTPDDPIIGNGPFPSGVLYIPGTLQAHRIGCVTFDVEPLVIDGDKVIRDWRYEQDPYGEWDY